MYFAASPSNDIGQVGANERLPMKTARHDDSAVIDLYALGFATYDLRKDSADLISWESAGHRKILWRTRLVAQQMSTFLSRIRLIDCRLSKQCLN
jgi:hypothetical protein